MMSVTGRACGQSLVWAEAGETAASAAAAPATARVVRRRRGRLVMNSPGWNRGNGSAQRVEQILCRLVFSSFIYGEFGICFFLIFTSRSVFVSKWLEAQHSARIWRAAARSFKHTGCSCWRACVVDARGALHRGRHSQLGASAVQRAQQVAHQVVCRLQPRVDAQQRARQGPRASRACRPVHRQAKALVAAP